MRIGALLGLVLLAATPVFGHDLSASYSNIRVEGADVYVQFTMNLLGLQDGGTLDQNDREHIAEIIESNYHLEGPELPSATVLEQSEFITDNVIRLDLLYKFDHTLSEIRISSTLNRVTQADHTHLLQIGKGDDVREAVLDANRPTVDI